ncbi:hypothetical protein ACHHYP_02552 [Achlya hypogyna]|uniref:BED-type domain-containing protein n=1 Tax=Achlya hypogyna TaxID=1202772 RepID=A0A1V9Z5X8_ACHHY|nr:hypothetical protein ACHHYP_02552 [Achlya hypogyna]
MGNRVKFTTVPIESAKHGTLRIFKLKNISRPEIWANASLVAPNNAYECTSKEVTHFYCHLCDDLFGHDPTRLQNLHRHMKAKHLSDVQQIQMDMVPSDVGVPKRSFVQTLVEDSPEPKRARNQTPVQTTTFRSTRHGALSLFKVRHINRPEIWMYVSLVAPSDVQMNPVTGWTSRDATHFYCHLCDDIFGHDYVRSQNLTRHVKNKHKAEAEAYLKKLLKSVDNRTRQSSSQVKPPPPADLAALSPTGEADTTTAMTATHTRRCELALAEWLASCKRPIELVDDVLFQRFIKLVQATPGQFVPPPRPALEAHMDDLYSAKRKAVYALLEEECQFFSLSSKSQTLADASYLVWTLHFVSPTFEWRHVLLGQQPLPSDKPTPEWLGQALHRLLADWGLQPHHLAMVVSELDMRPVPVPSTVCLGQTLNAVLARVFCEKHDDAMADALEHLHDDYMYDVLSQPEPDAATPLQIPQLVRRVFLLAQYFHATPKAKRTLDHFASTQRAYDDKGLSVNCPRKWRKVYSMLAEWHRIKSGVDLFFSVVATQPASFPFPVTVANLTPAEWCLLEGLLALIEPCLEVMHAVCAAPNSLALMLSMLQLFAQDLSNPRFFALRGFPPEAVAREPFVEGVLFQLNTARHHVHSLLATFLEDHPAAWTSPLHPSVAATLAHCTPDEKTKVKARLQAECSHVTAERTHKPKTHLKYLQQVMGARDEILDSMTIMDLSIEDEVRMYFATVVPGVEDTLSWWKSHHDSFPRLATLARKWLGTTATAFHKMDDDVVDAAVVSPDLAARMAFLAENYEPSSL